jgi:hypothetical protein
MAVNDAEIKAFVDQNIKSPAVISQAAIDLDISVEDIARATGYSPNNVIDYFKNAGVRVPRTTSIAASQSTDEQINIFIKNNINDPAAVYSEAVARGIYYADDLARITGFTELAVRDYFGNAGFIPPPYRRQGLTIEQLIDAATPISERSEKNYIFFLNNVATTEFLRTKPASITNVLNWTEGKQEYNAYLASLGQPPFFDLSGGGGGGGGGGGSGGSGSGSGSGGGGGSGSGDGGANALGGGNKLILRLPPQDPLRPGRTNNASGTVPSPGVGAALSKEQISSNIERRVPQFQSVGFDKQRVRDEARYGISLEYLTNGAYDLQIRALSNPQGVVDVNVRYEYVPLGRNPEEAIVIWSLYDLEHIIVGSDIDRDAVREAALKFGISNAELASVIGVPENQVSAVLQGLALGPSSDLKNPPGKFLQVIKPSAGAF